MWHGTLQCIIDCTSEDKKKKRRFRDQNDFFLLLVGLFFSPFYIHPESASSLMLIVDVSDRAVWRS